LWKTIHGDGSLQLLRGKYATEPLFRQSSKDCRFIHIATHGFFAPSTVQSALFTGEHKSDCRYRDLAKEQFLRPQQDPSFWQYNFAKNLSTPWMKGRLGSNERQIHNSCCWHPGLLSGIVLTGANLIDGHELVASAVAEPASQLGKGVDTNPAGRDDGILTALEVADLDLRGTELVALSACETGLGEEAGGEGLWGLQRAFHAAGARTVVASLWTVDDHITQELMSRYYTNLWHKRMGKLAALRAAQLSLLNREVRKEQHPVRGPGATAMSDGRISMHATTERAHPRFWAAWVLSGDPGELPQLDATSPVGTTAPTTDITRRGNSKPLTNCLRTTLNLSVTCGILLLVSVWHVRRRFLR
jgi:hypothetical protein